MFGPKKINHCKMTGRMLQGHTVESNLFISFLNIIHIIRTMTKIHWKPQPNIVKACILRGPGNRETRNSKVYLPILGHLLVKRLVYLILQLYATIAVKS